MKKPHERLLTTVTALILISTGHAGHIPVIFEGTGLPLREARPGTPVVPGFTETPFLASDSPDSLSNVTIREDGRVVFAPFLREDLANDIPVLCGNYELQPGESLTVASPNFPEDYPLRFWCRWQFTAVGGTEKLSLTCSDFDLYVNDFLRVMEFDVTGIKYSLTDAPEVTATEGNVLILRFVSNPWNAAPGFKCTVSHVDEPTTTTSTTTTTTTTTTTPTTTTTTTSTTTTSVSHPDCGFKRETRIANGEYTEPNEYPWQVKLSMRWSDGHRRSCGGTIINEQWILTAAHCTYRTNRPGTSLYYPTVRVLVSAHIHTRPSATGGYWTIADSIHMNPGYRLATDIALIKLRIPLEFSDTIAPICLPPSSWEPRTFEDELLTLIGWGRTETGTYPYKLKEYDTVGYSFPQCNEFYEDMLEETQMCTDGSEKKHTCKGDSGGPVMYTESNGRIYQAGIISFGASNTCRHEDPDGHVRVAAFTDWIQEVIAENS